MICFCYLMDDNNFSEWLENQLKIRGWTQADLVKASRVTSAQISRILNGTRDPGPDVCNAIARALVIPPETVFRAAGLLPPALSSNPTLEEANYKLAKLQDWQQQIVMRFIDSLLEQGNHENPPVSVAPSQPKR